MIIEHGDPNSTDAEVGAETVAGADVDFGTPERDASLRRNGSTQDPTSELSEPLDPSGLIDSVMLRTVATLTGRNSC